MLGFFLDYNIDGTFRIDHLKRLRPNASSKWRRPTSDDIQDAVDEQIITCKVFGDWGIGDDEISIFVCA